MPSLSPGKDKISTFKQILPGAPTVGYQSIVSFTFRWKRYVLYLAFQQLNILREPAELAQAISFDDSLLAIACEAGEGGRFAVATQHQAWVLKPTTSPSNKVIWVKELRLKHNDGENQIHTLSWGTEGELLVGGTKEVCSYDTLPSSRVTSPGAGAKGEPEDRGAQWSKRLASSVKFAAFSPSASLIATTGDTDRLVKIWRRLSYEEAIFDYAYLPHNGVVTHLEWRPADVEKLDAAIERIPTHVSHDETCEVLYTMNTHGILSIWRTSGHSEFEIMTLFTVIDLVSAIPHSPILTTDSQSQRSARFAFVLSASAYTSAVEAALRKHPQRELKHGIEHLKEVSSKQPDVIIALDTLGRMSAWGLSSVGQRQQIETAELTQSPFHIAHSKQMGLTFESDWPTTFQTWFEGDLLNVVAHTFAHNVKWWKGTVENFSSSAALDVDRGELLAVWDGSCSVTNLKPVSDQTFEVCSTAMPMQRYNLDSSRSYHRVELARTGTGAPAVIDVDDVLQPSGTIYLKSQSITVCTRGRYPCVDKTLPPGLRDTGTRLLRLDRAHNSESDVFLVFNRAGCYALASIAQITSSKQKPSTLSLPLEASEINLERASPIVAFDAMLHPRKVRYLRIVGLDEDGVLHRRDVSYDSLNDGAVSPEPAMHFETGIIPGQLVATSSCAVVLSASGNELVILDLKEGYVEHQCKVTEKAYSIAVPRRSPEDTSLTEHSVMALGYKSSVDVLIRSRYDHLHHSAEPHWTTVKRISITSTGLDIGCVTWLGNDQLAITGNNSIFISDNTLDAKLLDIRHQQELDLTDDTELSIRALVSLAQGPLTCWQPHVLRQLLLHNHFDNAVTILLQLQSKLRFYSNGDELDATLGLDVQQLLFSTNSYEADNIDLSELGDQLQELDLPYTSDADQQKLRLFAETVSYVLRHKGSLDVNAVRYLAHWRYHVLLDHHTHHAMNGSATGTTLDQSVDVSARKAVPQMTWREINFAYHSATQQPLLELLLQYYEGKLDWHIVRSLGITLWLHNIKATQSEGANMSSVEQVFDALAQNAYRASEPPSPADASLFLLAIRKKTVLLSLWRVAVGNREQKTTQNFLRRDFESEENKTAARKNAYALMGKRRFQYAAAFFLLADDPSSALSVLAGQLEDLPLAISVARAYCGDGSNIMKKFFADRVFPEARRMSDRWLLSWAYALAADSMQMLRALIANIAVTADGSERNVRSWQQDDPVTLVFYREMRDKVKVEIDSADEYRAVLRAARILRRMGFWLLALRMVETWSFPSVPATTEQDAPQTTGSVGTTPNMLDQFGETSDARAGPQPSILATFGHAPAATNATTDEAEIRAAKAAALLAKIKAKNAKKDESAPAPAPASAKAPTQFQEPAASSILDSFGF